MNLQSHADRIHTGTEDAKTSRALVVYNLTDAPVTGVAVFFVSMSWPIGTPLPPVSVSDERGQNVPSTITDIETGQDSKGRADRQQMTFQMRFWVEDIPAQSWRTYIAAYVTDRKPAPIEMREMTATDLIVIETLRHEGDLPMQGTF